MSEVTRATLTIVVPTYNRPAFLVRLLRYYEACGAPCPIRILDSSSDSVEDRRLDRLLAAAHVTYARYNAATPPLSKISEGLRQVTTPYAVLWADDDLMVPRALMAGVRFLDEHQDFSAAHGHSGLFQTGTDHGRRVVVGISDYRQRSYTATTASQRVTDCFMDYTNLFYSVHRTAQLRGNVERCLSYELGSARYSRDDWWVELALACLSVVPGKAWQMNTLYMMRDRHAGVDSWEADGAKLDRFDWVASPSFSAAYRAFASCLADAVARQDGLGSHEAHEAIKRAFWFHLAKNLTRKWQARYRTSRGVRVRVREAARRLPGLRTVWRKAQHLVPHRPGALSLPALLQASSRYHEDFMPIYRTVTADAMPEEIQGDAVTSAAEDGMVMGRIG